MIKMGSQLCDVNVLLDYLGDKAMSQNEWEIYMQDYLSNMTSSNSDSGDDCDSDKKYTQKQMDAQFLEGIFVGIAVGSFGAILVGIIYFVARRYGDRIDNSRTTQSRYTAFTSSVVGTN